jgi:predicted tellurium resistance membrane protein TerC
LVKTISEIHHKVEGPEEETGVKAKPRSFGGVVGMIILIDMVFSFDSILTAVGMVSEISIMIVAVVIAMVVMLVFVNKISRIISNHPSIQMLALSFLILIAFVLILDGLHKHIERGYVYFALFFSLIVEVLNIRSRKNRKKTA